VPPGGTKQDRTGLNPAGFTLGGGSNRTATYQQPDSNLTRTEEGDEQRLKAEGQRLKMMRQNGTGINHGWTRSLTAKDAEYANGFGKMAGESWQMGSKFQRSQFQDFKTLTLPDFRRKLSRRANRIRERKILRQTGSVDR
jgi:hypothetical protein